MNDNLITEIIDLNKVKMNLLELQKMWEQLITTMAAKSGKDLKFDDLAKNLKIVTQAEKELAKTKQAGLEVDGKKVKITAEIIGNYEKYSKEDKKIIENEIKRKAQIAETNKLLKDKFTNEQNLVKVLQRETKSIADLDKQNKDLQRIQQKLNFTTKEGLDANAKINAQIEKNKQTTKEYTNAIDKQRRNIGNYKSATEGATGATGKMGASFAAAAAGITIAIAAIKKIGAAVKESIDLFITQEKQAFRVEKVFGSYAKEINDAANATQSMTTIGNEAYQSLAFAANSYGVAAKDTNDVVQKAIGLAEKYEKIQPEKAIQMLARAQEGNYEAFKRYIPELENVTSQTEAMNLINAKAAEGFDIATEYADTFGGKMTQIKNAAGDLKEVIGEQFLTGLVGDPQEGDKAIGFINKLAEALEKTEVLSKYLANIREQASMMLKPFHNLMQVFGDGGDAIDGLTKAFNFYFKIVNALATPVKLIWSLLSALTGVIVDIAKPVRVFAEQIKEVSSVSDGFRLLWEKIKSIKIQDIFNIVNKAIVELISPITDLIGYGDEVKKFFGIIQDEAKITTENLDKMQSIMSDPLGAGKKFVEDQKAAAEAAEEAAKKLKDEKDALNDIKSAYAAYNEAIRKANEEAKLQIELGEKAVIVRIKESEAIYEATKNLFALNGYTDAEIEKLKELKKSIDDMNLAISNTPELLSKQDPKTIESVAKNTGEISMNMRDMSPAVNNTAAQFTKLEQITAKLRNAFNDFFGTEPIEDWRDTFKDSITQVYNESLELFNTVIEMQSETLNDELDSISKLYDKQVEVLDATYEKRKSLLEATIDDEAELAAALAKIEQEKIDNQNKLQDEKFAKEEEIARKQAILEKKKAAMEVATGSATALVEAIKLIGIATTTAAPGDPYSLVARIAAALAAALTVVGATTAGIAKVKSIQIPQFWTGGEAQEGQLISVAERGKELAVGESGKSYMFDKQSVLVAPEKMRIFSNKETKQIMEKQTINNTYEKKSNVNLTVNIDNERHKKYFKLN